MSAITTSGGVDAVGGDQVVTGQERIELAPEEEVDPTQQDRRHGQEGKAATCGSRSRSPTASRSRAPGGYSRRTRRSKTPGAPLRPTSATSSRGSCTSSSPGTRTAAGTETAAAGSWRKPRAGLRPTPPSHRGVDVAALLAQVERARPGAMPELE